MKKEDQLIKLDQELTEIGKYYQQFLNRIIPDKEIFFSELQNKIQLKEKNFNQIQEKKLTKPLSTFWEQLFFSSSSKYVLSFSFIFFFILGISFYFFIKRPQLQEEETPKFGNSFSNLQEEIKKEQLKNALPNQQKLNEELEKEMINKILNEEDSIKKQQYIEELIEFYKKTNQIEKIQKIYETLE